MFLVVVAALSWRLEAPRLHTDEITYMQSVLDSIARGAVWPLDGPAPFLNKPPGALWTIRGAFHLLGATVSAARWPAVLATGATAALLVGLGAAAWRLRVGVLAAALFVALPGPLLEHAHRAATPDALDILLVTVAVTALEAWRRGARPQARTAFVLATAATAWVKSPFAGVVVLTYLLVSEAVNRRRRPTPRFASTALAATAAWLLSCGAWLASLSLLTSPETVATRLLRQQYGRRIEGRLGPGHVAGPGFYLETAWDDFGVLLLLALVALGSALVRRRAPAAAAPSAGAHLAAARLATAPPAAAPVELRSVAVWAAVAPLLATASASKLAWYGYLSYPAVALLVAIGADRLARALPGRALQAMLLVAVAAFAVARLPHAELWPAVALRRGPAACLETVREAGVWFDEARADEGRRPHRRRRGGPRFDDTAREARFFVAAASWHQERAGGVPGTCRARLASDGGPGAVALSAAPPGSRAPRIFVHDRCAGRAAAILRRCGAVAADTSAPPPPAAPPVRPRHRRVGRGAAR